MVEVPLSSGGLMMNLLCNKDRRRSTDFLFTEMIAFAFERVIIEVMGARDPGLPCSYLPLSLPPAC
jgi:hypothetical protein